jgi:hypothetical protein
MEPLSHGAIRFRQLGDLRQPRFAYRFPSLRWWLTVCSRAARPARLARSVSSTSTSTRRTPPTPAQNWTRGWCSDQGPGVSRRAACRARCVGLPELRDLHATSRS